MSQSVDSREDIPLPDDRKRKLDASPSKDDNKKPKLNASLGLSLLQAYDEEEQCSDEENHPTKVEDETTEPKSSEITDACEKSVPADDGITSDNSVSCPIEKEEIIKPSAVDVTEEKIDEEITNESSTAENENMNSTRIENDEIILDRLDSGESKEKNETKETALDTIDLKASILELDVMGPSKTVENTSKPVLLDHDTPVNADSKPVRKVKLNRSKFARPVMKISPPTSDLTVVDQKSSILDAPRNEKKSIELNIAPTKPESMVVMTEERTINAEKVIDETTEEVNFKQTKIEETMKEINIEETMGEKTEETRKEINIQRIEEEKKEDTTKEIHTEEIMKERTEETTKEIIIEEAMKEKTAETTKEVIIEEAMKEETEETSKEINIEKTMKKNTEESTKDVDIEKIMNEKIEGTTEEINVGETMKEASIDETTKEVDSGETTKEVDIEEVKKVDIENVTKEGTSNEVNIEEISADKVSIEEAAKEVSIIEASKDISIKETSKEVSITPHLIDDKNNQSISEELKVTGKTCSVLLTPLICKDSKIVQLVEKNENIQLSTPVEVSIPQKNSSNKETPSLESVKSIKSERVSLRTSRKLKSDEETQRSKSANKDISTAEKDNSVTINDETMKDLSGTKEETKTLLKDSPREIQVTKKFVDSQASRNEDSKDEISASKKVQETLKKEENTTLDVQSDGLSKSEIVEDTTKFSKELGHVRLDREELNLATETAEGKQDRTIQKPTANVHRTIQKPTACKSKSVEISKLEQALTGRMENVQSHSRKDDCRVGVKRKTSDTELGPAVGDTKRNIKLHLSVQGDRISIKNAQSVSKVSTVLPVREKRQYRKREKIPGELEAKQASAKEYANRLRQRADRETPGAKKRGRKKKNEDSDSAEIVSDHQANSNSPKPTEEVVPSLKVALNKVPSRKSSVVGKVQPIKLKISKNANVTIECTSKYDVCSADNESIDNSINVNEKIVGILEEARKKDGPLPSCVETVSSAWSGPDLQRVERLLKESNITITPVATGHEVSQQPSSVLEPILNSKEKLSLPATIVEAESKTSTIIASVNEDNVISVNKPLKTSLEERIIPMSTPVNDSKTSSIITAPATNSVDVKSEIRKKIASVEKRKQDVNIPDENPFSMSLPKTVISSDISSPSTNELLPQSPYLENATLPTDLDASEVTIPESLPTFTPVIHKTPTKHANLPAELFPKKRGRPTKAMVAAREAYRQQQEELGKHKDQFYTPGEMDIPSDISLINTPPIEPIKIKRGRKPKHERLEKKDSDDLSYEELPFDPAREAEEQRRVEEERVKKEEERERKNEMRRLKAKERSDLVKAKRLRQKMKAKERHKLAKELRRLQQEEKKKLEEQLKRLPMGFDDETRMSAENSQAVNMSFSIGMADDDSSGATNDLSQKLKKSRMEVADSDSKDLMVDQVAEYQWPIQGGDLYMIQEQVSNFLGVKSFKRKYPDIWRRPVDSEERAYLVDSGLVSETLCDLGITAVRSAELLDIMCSDFPEKYEEFRRYMRDKQMKELSFKQRAWANGLGYKLLMADGSKQDMKKRAMESVSNWNSALNKSRKEDRRCHMDLQTFIIHHPKQRGIRMTVPSPKVGSYPVTILPGQFCDYYKEYTPTELRYLPINTVLYGPLKHPTAMLNDDASQTDSDDSSSSDDSSTTSEDTQATEETLEDIDKDLCLEGNTTRFGDKDSSFVGDEEPMQKETNNDYILPTENDKMKILCKVCLGDQSRNKMNMPEVLICCSQCASTNHPTCLDLSLNIVPRIRSYAWQCPDCKICAQCKENADEDKMLFCDTCDRGYHIYCVGLIKVPAGNWQCKECSTLMTETKFNIAEVSVPKESHSSLIEITG